MEPSLNQLVSQLENLPMPSGLSWGVGDRNAGIGYGCCTGRSETL
ncbi:hypothetical protein SLEP1_g940 [Rubroshorea leprosula]|uniref:Uncharacterized protein n=1 Tax=Rubroshorea leprosula TaxID=152421 RepID=A0AAV5HMM4_9ROSI|nr:hypothetical protein SLEP1_g940 [Rubroshorea leprosula]